MSDYAARFVSGLVGNPEDRFSDVAAHFWTFIRLQLEVLTSNMVNNHTLTWLGERTAFGMDMA